MSYGFGTYFSDGSPQITYTDRTARIIGQARLEFLSATSGTQTLNVTVPDIVATDTLILNVYGNQKLLHEYSINGTTITITRYSNVYQPAASSVIVIFVRTT